MHSLVHSQLQQWGAGEDHPVTVPLPHDCHNGAVDLNSPLVPTYAEVTRGLLL